MSDNEKRTRKNAWDLIFENFKALYPTLSKNVIGFHPYVHPMIFVDLNNGQRMLYDDGRKKAKFI